VYDDLSHITHHTLVLLCTAIVACCTAVDRELRALYTAVYRSRAQRRLSFTMATVVLSKASPNEERMPGDKGEK